MRIVTSSNANSQDITALSIDWEKVAQKMDELKKKKEIEDNEEEITKIEITDETDDVEEENKKEEEETCEDEECEEKEVEIKEEDKGKEDEELQDKEACKKKKVKASEAIGVCKECGLYRPCSHDLDRAANEMEYKAMVRKRIMRRLAAISELDELQKDKMLSARARLRRDLLAYINSKKGGHVVKSYRNQGRFVKINDSNVAKRAFIDFAKKQGWPEQYIRAMVGKLEARDIPESVKRVLASSLPREEKKRIIISMYKDAKLSKEEAERIYRYWKEELGYQDEEWIRDLIKNYE